MCAKDCQGKTSPAKSLKEIIKEVRRERGREGNRERGKEKGGGGGEEGERERYTRAAYTFGLRIIIAHNFHK
jgi:hypothetical protein